MPRPRSSSSSARTVRRPAGSSALVGSSRTRNARRADHRLCDPEPLLHALRHLVDLRPSTSARPTSSSSRPRSAGPPSEPARPWCRRITSSARSHPGKRKSSAR